MALTKLSDVQDPRVRHLHLTDGREMVVVDAGYLGSERVVPPAGEEYAYWRDEFRRRVEVYRSATGRSVRVFVDAEEAL